MRVTSPGFITSTEAAPAPQDTTPPPLSGAVACPYPAKAVTRFLSRIDTSAGPNACHPWTRALDRDGYGDFYPGGKRHRAHRFALELRFGRLLAPGEVARHSNSCTTKACCNGAHLLAGTQADNMRDRDEAGKTPIGERHWKSKLTDDLVLSIRARAAAGETGKSISRDLGISGHTVSCVVTGRTWRHLPLAVSL